MIPTSSGNPYVLDQVNAIESLTLAANVKKALLNFNGKADDLRRHVRAEEIGASPTIEISYTADTAHNAADIAKTYAHQYVQWSNEQAIASLLELSKSVNADWRSITAQGTAMAQSREAPRCSPRRSASRMRSRCTGRPTPSWSPATAASAAPTARGSTTRSSRSPRCRPRPAR